MISNDNYFRPRPPHTESPLWLFQFMAVSLGLSIFHCLVRRSCRMACCVWSHAALAFLHPLGFLAAPPKGQGHRTVTKISPSPEA